MRLVRPSKLKSHQEEILNLVEQVWAEVLPILNDKYPQFVRDFQVSLNPRLRTTGGRVLVDRYTKRGRMELNEKLLAANLDQVRMVFIHELAHLVQFQLSGYSDHGYAFQKIMEVLGHKGTTYMPKNLNPRLGQKKKSEHAYQCEEGCVHMVSTRKHNMIQRGKASYSCRKSGKKLVLITATNPLEQQILNQLQEAA